MRLVIHPLNPQNRVVTRAVEMMRAGALLVYPSDTGYALGWALMQKATEDRVRLLRDLEDKHPFTLMCRDLRQVAMYARLDDSAFRILKQRTPGPYTFILPAARELPRRLLDGKRRAIGVHIAEHRVVDSLIDALDEPFLSTSLKVPGLELDGIDPEEMHDQLGKRVDIMLDAGACASNPSTVVDLTGSSPQVLRLGQGKVDFQ
jgi:tRNA threonylcarbamoyl adenosine modification protein (Sua5/YciO/YrdC/YwlC family)